MRAALLPPLTFTLYCSTACCCREIHSVARRWREDRAVRHAARRSTDDARGTAPLRAPQVPFAAIFRWQAGRRKPPRSDLVSVSTEYALCMTIFVMGMLVCRSRAELLAQVRSATFYLACRSLSGFCWSLSIRAPSRASAPNAYSNLQMMTCGISTSCKKPCLALY